MIKKNLILLSVLIIIPIFAILVIAKKDTSPKDTQKVAKTKDEQVIESVLPSETTKIAKVSPTAIPTPIPTKIPLIAASNSTVNPPAKFVTLPPGSPLPSDKECASKVRHSPFEPRPQNFTANNTKASGGPYISDVFMPEKITGNFTGTTDEIIQWGACKWGFDEDIIRAIAVQESSWKMDDVGDNGRSFGLLQIKRTVHDNTYPFSANSTSFNVDYALSYRRACFEGYHSWIRKKGYSNYSKGDEWGCIGAWFSGKWYDGDANISHSGGNWYIKEVKNHLQNRTWTKPDF